MHFSCRVLSIRRATKASKKTNGCWLTFKIPRNSFANAWTEIYGRTRRWPVFWRQTSSSGKLISSIQWDSASISSTPWRAFRSLVLWIQPQANSWKRFAGSALPRSSLRMVSGGFSFVGLFYFLNEDMYMWVPFWWHTGVLKLPNA